MPIPLGIFATAGASASAPPAMELISTQTFGGAGGSVTFSSIPQSYKHLKMIWNARSTGTSSESFSMLCVRINNATSQYSGYPGTTYGYDSTTETYTGYLADNYIPGGGTSLSASRYAMPSSNVNSSDGNTFGYGEMFIPNYATSSFSRRAITMRGGSQPRGGGSYITNDGYLNGAAVSTLTFFVYSPGNQNFANFQAGTSFSLYGYLG